MIRCGGKYGRGLAALLIAGLLSINLTGMVFAGPGGPAEDYELTEGRKQQKKAGPGTVVSEPEQTTEQPAQDTGRPEQAAGQPEQAAGQPERATEQHQDAAQAAQTAEQPAQATGQPEQAAGQQEQAAAQPEPAVPQEGLIASGGRYLDPTRPMVALTFDDGPYAPVGNRIMDSLEQHQGRATFFVVGNRVAAYREEILRMHQNGHEVANHTYDHKYLNKLGAEEIRSQIERCSQAIQAVTGERPALVRLPGGNKNQTVLSNVSYPMIMWSIDTLDWKTKNAGKTVQTVLNTVQDGDVILMHELYTASGDAAVTLVSALTERGFQLVTVSELARFRKNLQPGTLYYNFYH